MEVGDGKLGLISPSGHDNASVKIDSLSLNYRIEGNLHQVSLVLLHGLNGHSGTWRKNIPYFSEKWQVVAPSLPTYRGPIDSVPVEKYTGYVEELVSKLGITRAVFIGNSMGGWISMLMAVRYPILVSALVLEDTAGAANHEMRDTPEIINSIHVPVKIIWGEDDDIISPAHGSRLASRISNSEFVVIEGAGHVPHWDKPDEFNRIVDDFLSGSLKKS